MPIRYFIDLDCRPRQKLGGEELLNLVTRWERANSVRSQYQQKHGETDETRMRYREQFVNLGEEPEVREVTVAEVREEASPLEELSAHCHNCPAALTATPFSCIQQINFPISEAGEKWLVGQVAPSGTRGAELFLQACESQQYGTNPLFGNWRKAGLLETEEPAREERDGREVTSNQVLNELLLVGELMPPHALGVLIHLQGLRASDGRTGDELLDLIENVNQSGDAAEAPSIEFNLAPAEEDDSTVRQLKLSLYALFIAFSLQTPLAIRL